MTNLIEKTRKEFKEIKKDFKKLDLIDEIKTWAKYTTILTLFASPILLALCSYVNSHYPQNIEPTAVYSKDIGVIPIGHFEIDKQDLGNLNYYPQNKEK